MEDLLRDRVGLLRERIRTAPDGAALYRELSDLLLRAGKISAAMNILEKSLVAADAGGDAPDGAALRSADGKWFFDRALEYADAYLYEDAVECLRQALACGHATFEAHYCLAGVLKSLGRHDEAEEHCRRAIDLNPRFAPAYILLGALLKTRNLLDESIQACKKAVLLDPDCAAAYYDLACYFSLQEKREQALASIEMSFAKGFTDFAWAMQDPDLAALRGYPEFQLLIKSYKTE